MGYYRLSVKCRAKLLKGRCEVKVIADKERYVIIVEKDEMLSLTTLKAGRIVIEGKSN